MVYELADTEKATALFEGWSETLIWSCLQKVMGKIYVTDFEKPQSALAFVGCFAFYAGEPDRELVMHKPAGFVIMTPQNEAWASLIEECWPSAKKETARRTPRRDFWYYPDVVDRHPVLHVPTELHVHGLLHLRPLPGSYRFYGMDASSPGGRKSER